MRISRQLQERDRLKERLNMAYHMAQVCHQTSTQLIDRVQCCFKAIAKGTPQWVHHYGDGVRDTLNDQMYRKHLVFGGTVDGMFHSAHSDRADYYERQGIGPCEYADDGKVKQRGYYWSNTQGSKLFPFFVGSVKGTSLMHKSRYPSA